MLVYLLKYTWLCTMYPLIVFKIVIHKENKWIISFSGRNILWLEIPVSEVIPQDVCKVQMYANDYKNHLDVCWWLFTYRVRVLWLATCQAMCRLVPSCRCSSCGYTCVCIYMYLCVYARVCVYVCVHACAHALVCVCVCVWVPSVLACVEMSHCNWPVWNEYCVYSLNTNDAKLFWNNFN